MLYVKNKMHHVMVKKVFFFFYFLMMMRMLPKYMWEKSARNRAKCFAVIFLMNVRWKYKMQKDGSIFAKVINHTATYCFFCQSNFFFYFVSFSYIYCYYDRLKFFEIFALIPRCQFPNLYLPVKILVFFYPVIFNVLVTFNFIFWINNETKIFIHCLQ